MVFLILYTALYFIIKYNALDTNSSYILVKNPNRTLIFLRYKKIRFCCVIFNDIDKECDFYYSYYVINT